MSIFFLLILLYQSGIQSQTSNSILEGKIFSIQTEYSKVLPHHKTMYPLVERNFYNFRLDVMHQTFGEQYWEHYYNRPIMGVSFFYSSLSSPTQLGSAYAIIPFVNIPIFKSNKLKQNIKFGCGITYLTKTFDRLHNYRNIAIGSSFNCAINASYMISFPVTNHLSLGVGIGFTHFSNGAIKHPNLGINMASLNTSISWTQPSQEKILDIVRPDFDKHWNYQIYFFGGAKQLYIADPVLYGAYTFGVAAVRNYHMFRSFLLGTDLFYDFSEKIFYRDNGFEFTDLSFLKTGLYVGHKWKMNRLSLSIHVGSYVLKREELNNKNKIYNRLVLRYKIVDNLELNTSIKAHFGKADFIEFGFVYNGIIRKN